LNEIITLNLDQDRSLALFRIVQESFANIIKHAAATEVKVQLMMVDEKLVLEICDNGIGFDTKVRAHNEAYGLIGMRERAILLNATVDFISTVSKGTMVRISVNP